jgi:hypothetical protein
VLRGSVVVELQSFRALQGVVLPGKHGAGVYEAPGAPLLPGMRLMGYLLSTAQLGMHWPGALWVPVCSRGSGESAQQIANGCNFGFEAPERLSTGGASTIGLPRTMLLRLGRRCAATTISEQHCWCGTLVSQITALTPVLSLLPHLHFLGGSGRPGCV